MPAATEAFKLSTFEAIGILAKKSHESVTNLLIPFPMVRLSFPNGKVEEQISYQHQADSQSSHVGI